MRAAVLRRWLHASGSLSRRLATLGERFEVQTLRQGCARLHRHERQQLGLHRPGRTWVREVLLRVDGEPLIWARSIAPRLSLCGPWRALLGLGTRPLADLLFREPRVTRTPLRQERLRRGGPVRGRLERQWQGANGHAAPHNMVWARRSVFRKHGAPLQVMEAFAPRLALHKPQRVNVSASPHGYAGRSSAKARTSTMSR